MAPRISCEGVISQELLVLQHPGLQGCCGPKEKCSTPTVPCLWELQRPYQVLLAEVGVELQGCLSRAVLGHQLLSRMLCLLVQQ